MPHANPYLDKINWQVASKLPGPPSWNKMRVAGKGLAPLNKETDAPALPPHVQVNPFLRNAWLRAFAKAESPAPKTAHLKLAAGKLDAFKHLWRAMRGSGAASRSAESLAKRLGSGTGEGWKNLFAESGRGGQFGRMSEQVGPAFGRAFGGAYIGHQFDSADEEATPWGSIIGGVAGLGSPAAFRRLLGNRMAPKNSLRRLFADRTVSRRLVNDPLNRVMLSAGMGNLFDMGAGALGYDTGGWGERIGIAGGLGGGMRPLSQALAGRYKGVDRALQSIKKVPGIAPAFEKAQQGGFTYLPSYLLGSPYVARGGAAATAGFVAHPLLEASIGDRMRNIAEKKKMLTSTLNTPEMSSAKAMIEKTMKQVYGPQARFYDPDGLPSMEAIQLIQHLGKYGIMQLQNAGHRYFGNPQYMMNPQNWERLASPTSAFGDFVRGQATRLNPLPF